MTDKKQGLYFEGTAQDAKDILTRLAIENPDMTIREYLDKYHTDFLILN